MMGNRLRLRDKLKIPQGSNPVSVSLPRVNRRDSNLRHQVFETIIQAKGNNKIIPCHPIDTSYGTEFHFASYPSR
jgi:hypothetical protein